MADENTTANLDPFAAYAVPSQKSNTDDFGKFIDDTLGGTPIGAQTSATGEFFRGAARSTIPAAGGFAAAGAGAELGAGVGAVAGPIGAALGGFAGGLGGFFGGSYLAGKAQDFVADKLPNRFLEATGFDEKTQIAGQQQHPIAGFVGGFAPYALTSWPTLATKTLPATASTLERLMNSQLGSRAFGGLMMGGLEAQSEYQENQPFDWTKVAISTGFGLVFNGHTPIAQKLNNFGARAISGSPVTVAEARASGIYGAEETITGSAQRPPDVERADQLPALIETMAVGHNQYSINADSAARKIDKDGLFAKQDELIAQRNDIKQHFESFANPSEEYLTAAQERLENAQDQLDRHNGISGVYARGPQQRRLMVQVKAAQADLDDALARRRTFRSGEVPHTAEMTAALSQMAKIDDQLWALREPINYLRRQAADMYNSEVVEPQPVANRIVPTEAQKEEVRRNGATLFPETETQVARPTGEAAKLPLAALDMFGTATNTEQVGTAGAPALITEKEQGTWVTRNGVTTKISEPTKVQNAEVKDPAEKFDPEAFKRHKELTELRKYLLETNDQFKINGKTGAENAAEELKALEPRLQRAREQAAAESTPVAPNVSTAPIAPVVAAKPAKVSQPIAIQFEYIKQDMMKRLAYVKIPENELEAHAEFFAHEFVARAENMKGLYGDAVDLYRKDYFDILNKVTGARAPKPSVPSWLVETKNSVPANKVIEPVKINGKTIEELTAEPHASTEEIKTEQKAVSEQQKDLKTQIETKGVDSIKKFDPNETLKFSSPEEAKKGVNRLFDVESLITDANRMQYKSGGDEFGVTDELKNTKAWVPEQGQGILVWQERNGNLIVVDGHQRTGLARWLIKNGIEKHIDIPGVLIREVDGVTVEDARVRGAMINIVRGSGSALDGATIMRMHPEYLEGATSKSAEKPRNLAVLSDEAFGYVKQGIGGITEDQGALVGRELKNDGVRQLQALHLITELKPKNAAETKYIIDRVKNANVAKAEGQAQIEMFGKIDLPNIKAESQISGDVNSILAQITRQTKTAATGAENILGKIDVAGNIAKSETTSQISEYFDRTKFSAGSVVADVLKENARDLTDKKITRDQAVQNVRKAVETDYERFKKEGSIYRDENGQPISEVAETDENQATLFQKKKKAPPNASIILNSNANGRDLMTIFRTRNASSLFHEGAHRFLNNLMRDSRHPDAPEQVKDDAKKILEFLGVEDFSQAAKGSREEQLWAVAHEKLARAYERYLRDETAPSPALARLFQTLNKWFRQIYKSADELGVPINENIRSIFDRFLTSEPRRTIITGDRPEPVTLADEHIKDAQTVKASEAEVAAERIADEKNRNLEGVSPEILAELQAAHAKIGELNSELEAALTKASSATQPPAEGGAGAAGAKNMGEGGARPEPVTAGGGGGRVDEQVKPSGSETRNEGVGVPKPAIDDARNGNASGIHPLAPRSKPDISSKSESKRLDKAGNIIVANVRSIADLREAINDQMHANAESNNDFLAARQGVIPDVEVQRMADILGLPQARVNLDNWTVGHAANSVEVVLGRRLLEQSLAETATLEKKARQTRAPEDVIAFLESREDNVRIQEYFSGITAESGRATRAFRKSAELKSDLERANYIKRDFGQTLYQALQEIDRGALQDTPEKQAKFYRDAKKFSGTNMALEIFINNIISGLATHMTYLTGNGIMAAERTAAQVPTAAAIGMLRTVLGRTGNTVSFGEIGARLKGYKQGFAPGMKAAVDALRTGKMTLLPGEEGYETQKTFDLYNTGGTPAERLDPNADWVAVGSALHALMQAPRDAFKAGQALIDSNTIKGANGIAPIYSENGATPDVALFGYYLPTGELVRMPSRAVGALHAVLYAGNYSAEIRQLAYRQAAEEGHVDSDFHARTAYLAQNPTAEMMETAMFEAKRTSLLSKGGKITNALTNLTNQKILGAPLIKFVLPFARISGDILARTLSERTPLGFLSSDVRAELFSKDNYVADMAAARMLIGTTVATLFGSLAAAGQMTGSGPVNRDEANLWRMAGYQPHSVKIGDMFYDLHRLGPLGLLASLGADFYEVAHKLPTETAAQIAASVVQSISKNILDESFMKGPADLIKALDEPDRFGASYIKNFVSSFVPYSAMLSQLDRNTDPYMRETRSLLDAVKSKIPYESDTLLPKRDIWGEPIQHPASIGGPLSSIYESHLNRDPVILAMMDLHIHPAQVERKIANVVLTDEQFDRYAQIAGRMTKKNLDTLVASTAFKQMNDEQRHDSINEVIKRTRDTARGMIKMEYQDIVIKATQQKKNGFPGATPR